MKVRIDSDECAGDGTCVELCPQIFHLKGDLAEVRTEIVPQDLEDLCREAAEACPFEAIKIEE